MQKNTTTFLKSKELSLFIFLICFFYQSLANSNENIFTEKGKQELILTCGKPIFHDYVLKNFFFYKNKYSEFLLIAKDTSSPADSATELIVKYWDLEDKDLDKNKNPQEKDPAKLFASFTFRIQLETSRTLFLEFPLAKDGKFLRSEVSRICLRNISSLMTRL